MIVQSKQSSLKGTSQDSQFQAVLLVYNISFSTSCVRTTSGSILHGKCGSWSHSLLPRSQRRLVWLWAQQSVWIQNAHSSLGRQPVEFTFKKRGKLPGTVQQGASFLLVLTLELHEELLDSVVTWAVPYKEPLTDWQRVAGFGGDSSKVNGQHLVRKATALVVRILWKNWNRRYSTNLDGWSSFLQTSDLSLQPIVSNDGQRYILLRVIVWYRIRTGN